jgi:ribosomal-protein-alanine N-acetyltransferase
MRGKYSMLNHLGTINIETKRLCLRKLSIDDARDVFHHWTGDSLIMWRNGVHKSLEQTTKEMKKWIKCYEKKEYYEWGIELKENHEIIGAICTINNDEETKSCEIAYNISKFHRNKGYMTETLFCILRFLINEIGYNRIRGGHFVDNPASGRVMEKAGMKYEGTLRQNGKNMNGDIVDSKIYSLIKDDIQ